MRRYVSAETRKKLSEALKGNKNPMYGKHLSEETKRKLSEAQKGKHHSAEAKKKLSEANKGNKNPNYGKHYSAEAKKKMSEALKGKFKGDKSSNWKGGEVKMNCAICGKEKHFKPSRIKRGWGKFCSNRCSSIWKNKHRKNKDTDIERLMEDELIRREIPYTKQVPLLGITLVDFLLPHDTVIYCDGDYWHNLPGYKKRDAQQNFMLAFHGYKVFRFTGSDIKKSASKCIDKVINGNQMELPVVTEKEFVRIGG